MTDFVYNQLKTSDIMNNNAGERPLFGFAADDYIGFLKDKKQKVPGSINIVGVILETSDHAKSVENFINMICNTTGCDLAIFGLNLLPAGYDVNKLCKPLYDQSIFKELPNVYEDRLVFYRTIPTKVVMDSYYGEQCQQK